MTERQWVIASVAFFTIVLTIFFHPIFFGRIPFPADALVGLYHPYRDFYRAEFPNGIPFKNFLLTDPVLQTYPWRELAISELKTGRLPLWNSFTFSGTPLFANIQSALLNPFNIILFFAPFVIGWTILIVLQPVLGGLFFFLYARKLLLHPLASIFGGMVWVMGGFFLGWLEWGTVGYVALWLPLLLWCIEMMREKSTLGIKAVFLFGFFAQLVSGHLQTSFYLSILVLIYGLLRMRLRTHFVCMYVCAMFLGAIQLIPSTELLLLSARTLDLGNQTIGFLPWKHLAQFFAPDFFGNPSTLNYWGEWNYLEFIGYVGILSLVLIFAHPFWKSWHQKFFMGVIVTSFIFALPHPISRLFLSMPLLSTASPSRLLFLIDFGLAVIAAFGLNALMKGEVKKQSWFRSVGILSVGVLILWFFTTMMSSEQRLVSIRNLILPTGLLGAASIIGFFLKEKRFLFIACVLVVLTSFDLLRFANKFTPFFSIDFVYPQTKLLEGLSQDDNDFRVMSTDRRILPPNSTIPYRIKTVEGYDPVYFAAYGQYIASMEQEREEDLSLAFQRIITPKRIENEKFNALGVKYILSLEDIQSDSLVKIDQEEETRLYKNQAFEGVSYQSPHIDRFVLRPYSLMIGAGLSMIGLIGGIYVVASKNR